jgi:hypothetical protein
MSINTLINHRYEDDNLSSRLYTDDYGTEYSDNICELSFDDMDEDVQDKVGYAIPGVKRSNYHEDESI